MRVPKTYKASHWLFGGIGWPAYFMASVAHFGHFYKNNITGPCVFQAKAGGQGQNIF